MSLPNTIQLIAAIAGSSGAGGGGGGGGAVNLPAYNGGFNDSDVYLQSSGFSNQGSLIEPWAATSVVLFANGTGVYRRSNVNTGDTDYSFTWLNTGSNSDYFAFVTYNGASDLLTGTSSAVDTSLALTSNREWQLYVEAPEDNSYEQKTADIQVSIRDSSNNVLDSVNVAMWVSATWGILE